MKSYYTLSLITAAVAAMTLVSCVQEPRIVERPLPGYYGSPYNQSATASNHSDLLNQLQDPSSIGIQGPAVQEPNVVAPGTGTLAQMIGNSPKTGPQPGIQTTPQQIANNTNITGSSGVSPNSVNSGIANPRPVTPTSKNSSNENIPTAWVTEDPMIVISPYDRTKKISIRNSNGTRFPSGTVMRDPNFKNEVRKFRVP